VKHEPPRRPSGDGDGERALVLFLLSLVALGSPALSIWFGAACPWWTIYAVWLVIIGLSAALLGGRR